jgi:hypothetical protein
MSDLLNQAMQLDAVFACTSGGGFEEAFTFTPKGGTPREVKGIIDRQPPEQIGSDGQVKKPKTVIAVANDATHGIALSELTSGATVTFNLRVGVASTSATVPVSLENMPGNQDAAVLMLEV